MNEERRGREVLLYASFFVLTFLITCWISFRSVIIIDYGVLIERAWRIFLGQVPYRDLHFPTSPLTYMIQALVYKIFAPKIFWMTMYLAAMNSALVCMAIFFARKVLKIDFWTAALIVAPVALTWSPGIIYMRPWYDMDAHWFAFASLLFLGAGTVYQKRWAFFTAGIFSALSVFSKQNIGAGSTIAAFLFIFLQEGDIKERIKRSLLFIGGLTALTAAMSLYFLANGALFQMFDWMFLKARAKVGDGFLTRAAHIVFRPNNNFLKFAIVLYVAASIVFLRLRKSDPAGGSLKLGIALYSLFIMIMGCLAEGGNEYPGQQIYISVLMGMIVTHAMGPEFKFSFSLIKRPALLLVLFVWGIVFLWPIHIAWQVPFRYKVMRHTPDNDRLRGMRMFYPDCRFVQNLLDFEKKVPKDEAIFLWPDPMFFYFATDRRAPTGQNTFQPYRWEDPLEDIQKAPGLIAENNVVWAVIAQEQPDSFDWGHLRFGMKETWDEAVKNNVAMVTRGKDYGIIRDYLYQNFEEVPGGPNGYWLLKRKPGAAIR